MPGAAYQRKQGALTAWAHLWAAGYSQSPTSASSASTGARSPRRSAPRRWKRATPTCAPGICLEPFDAYSHVHLLLTGAPAKLTIDVRHLMLTCFFTAQVCRADLQRLHQVRHRAVSCTRFVMQSAGRRGAWQARSPLRRCARGSVGYSLLIKEEKMIKVPSCRCASCALIGQVCGQATGPQCLPAWRCVHAPVCVPCWSVQSLSRVMQSNPNPIRTWARVTAGVQRAALARHARRAEQAARSRVGVRLPKGASLPKPTS